MYDQVNLISSAINMLTCSLIQNHHSSFLVLFNSKFKTKHIDNHCGSFSNYAPTSSLRSNIKHCGSFSNQFPKSPSITVVVFNCEFECPVAHSRRSVLL